MILDDALFWMLQVSWPKDRFPLCSKRSLQSNSGVV